MKTYFKSDRVVSWTWAICSTILIILAFWLFHAATDAAALSTIVTLTYFKPDGKYYTTGEYESIYEHGPEIYEQVDYMIRTGINPGLVDGAVLRSEFAVLVQPKDGVPFLFTDFKAR